MGSAVCVSPGTETEIMAQMRDEFRGLGRHRNVKQYPKKRENCAVLDADLQAWLSVANLLI